MRICHVGCLVLMLSALLHAQIRSATPPKILPNSTRISEIRVVGSQRYGLSELVAATGRRIGDDGREQVLKEGADRLASSGMFAEVTYSYMSDPAGTQVEYRVHDVERLYPVQFENFVWMPRKELLTALKKKRPLFSGEVPNAGEMYTLLADDLKAILSDRNVTATVRVMPMVPQTGGRITGFTYEVEGIKIPIQAVEVPGASPDMLTVLKAQIAPKIGTDYGTTRMQLFAAMDLLPQYLMRGFLHARFGDHEVSAVEAASNAVTVRVPVEEGIQYQLAGFKWSGNTVYSPAELTKGCKVQIGKPANKVQLDEDLRGVGKIYGSRGYLEARAEARPIFDDAARAVSFQVDVSEGEQYRMGSLRLDDLPAPMQAQLRPLWKLRTGDIFDTGYFQVFMQSVARQFDLRGMRVSQNQVPHRDTKTVDVVVRITAL